MLTGRFSALRAGFSPWAEVDPGDQAKPEAFMGVSGGTGSYALCEPLFISFSKNAYGGSVVGQKQSVEDLHKIGQSIKHASYLCQPLN